MVCHMYALERTISRSWWVQFCVGRCWRNMTISWKSSFPSMSDHWNNKVKNLTFKIKKKWGKHQKPKLKEQWTDVPDSVNLESQFSDPDHWFDSLRTQKPPRSYFIDFFFYISGISTLWSIAEFISQQMHHPWWTILILWANLFTH